MKFKYLLEVNLIFTLWQALVIVTKPLRKLLPNFPFLKYEKITPSIVKDSRKVLRHAGHGTAARNSTNNWTMFHIHTASMKVLFIHLIPLKRSTRCTIVMVMKKF